MNVASLVAGIRLCIAGKKCSKFLHYPKYRPYQAISDKLYCECSWSGNIVAYYKVGYGKRLYKPNLQKIHRQPLLSFAF